MGTSLPYELSIGLVARAEWRENCGERSEHGGFGGRPRSIFMTTTQGSVPPSVELENPGETTLVESIFIWRGYGGRPPSYEPVRAVAFVRG